MQTSRDDTVVAVFSDVETARNAERELKEAGFRPDRIYSSADTGGDVVVTEAPPLDNRETSFTGWLKSLFGVEEHAHSVGYQKAFVNGQAIVGVVTSDEEADRAANILNRFSPIDVHVDDLGSAHGISTSDTESAGIRESTSDLLNARDELARPATTTGSVGIPKQSGPVRRYPSSQER